MVKCSGCNQSYHGEEMHFLWDENDGDYVLCEGCNIEEVAEQIFLSLEAHEEPEYLL